MPENSPAVGKAAPKFKLPNAEGKTVDMADHFGKKPVVIYFYPKADTPGCTVEACGFRDAIAGYKKLGVPVFGISPDPVADVKAFADKFELDFLLADEDHAVCEKYGVWVEKSMYGKKYMGAARTTFIVGKDGKIAHVFEKVKPEGHDTEVIEWLRANVAK
jgi:thioredoxin-dependent peroxiredoxin